MMMMMMMMSNLMMMMTISSSSMIIIMLFKQETTYEANCLHGCMLRLIDYISDQHYTRVKGKEYKEIKTKQINKPIKLIIHSLEMQKQQYVEN
jgi:hypothetical protein